MGVSVGASVPSLVTLAAAVANLGFVYAVLPYRDQPGGREFVAVAGMMAAIPAVYGAGLLVFEPLDLRVFLEGLTYLLILWGAFAWFSFALAYTGRGRLLRSRPMAVLTAALVGASVLILSNPVHGLIWSGMRVTRTMGAATVAFERGAGLFVVLAVVLSLMAWAFALLLDTLVSYGPLFRKQATALALTPVIPVAAGVAYVFELGPVPELNLLPLALVPHMLLDVYALFGSNMFDFDPATRRIGRRTAVDDLGNPVLTVDRHGRIIAYNAAAAELFGAGPESITGHQVERHLGVEWNEPETVLELRDDGRRRHYAAAVEPFSDEAGSRLGDTVVLQDVTDVVQREQRFAVLNRVLRHNLRNDLNVVQGHAEMVRNGVDDEDLRRSAETIVTKSEGLMALGDRAREFDRVIDAAGGEGPDDDGSGEPVALSTKVGEVRDEFDARYSTASITVDVPEELRVDVDPETLELVLSNLLENAVRHNDGDEPTVEVRLDGINEATRTAELAVVDDGPGIPDQELAVLQSGEETPLQHGSGLGLWVVQSGMTALGGDIHVESGGTGTTVTLHLPRVTTADEPERA